MTLQEYIIINPKLPQGVRIATETDIKKGVGAGEKLVRAKQYKRLVPAEDVMPGCIVEFQRDFKFFTVPGFLGGILKLLNRKWDGYGWHVGVVTRVDKKGEIKVLEAAAGGAREARIDNFYTQFGRNYRFWDLLGREATKEEIKTMIQKYEGKPYDFAAYFWTMLLYIGRHYINRSLPSVLNNKYMCWEMVYDAYRDFDCPIAGKDYDCPTLTELNLACRGLLKMSDKEHARYKEWRSRR